MRRLLHPFLTNLPTMSEFAGTTSAVTGFLLLLKGAGLTVLLSFGAILIGFVIALPVCLMRLSRTGALRRLGALYVSFFRGVPMLVQLLVIYYLLPLIGIDLGPFAAAIIAMGICTAAYQTENLRGGFLAIPAGQAEAARAFGYSAAQTRRHILLPQALRIATPALVNEVILLLKASSLVSVVGVTDLMRVSQNIVARNLNPVGWYLAASLIYLVINIAIAALGRRAEARFARGETGRSL
jgi:polar amino acid transport system permease protein